ncbi:MAG: Ig-like domain-containing protein, partial [Propionibacteriaceae bacterium]|nr:Ig-like domain-containing protein [Propionibacteriaceae bacterium]
YSIGLDNITGLYAISSPGEAELTVDAEPPDPPVITGPTDGTVTSNTQPTIHGTAEPDSHVVVKAANATLCSADADDNGNWSCAPTSGLDDGTYTITATATDAVGNQSDASDAVSFTVDTGAPDPPQITWPTNNGRAGSTPPIRGTGEPGAHVVVSEQGVDAPLCQADVADDGSWSCTPAAALPDGSHTITAQQTDAAANESDVSTAVTFTVDSHIPDPPSITGPSNGQIVATGQPSVTGTGESGSHVVVTTTGGQQVCEADVVANGSWSCTPATVLPDGPYTITATQTDDVGIGSDPSNQVSFTIDTTPPANPEILTPADGSLTNQVKPPVTGTGEANAHVVVTEGTKTICQTDVLTNGTWSCTPDDALDQGSHTFSAMQTDLAGLSSGTAQTTFTVDSVKPAAPSISSPSAGDSVGKQPVIVGVGEPHAHVTVWEGASKVCEADVTSTGAWSCTPTTALSEGQHTITASQTDAAQNRSDASPSVTFLVDTQPPAAPVFTAPAPGSFTNNPTPAISGTGEANAHLVVYDESGEVVCGADVDGNGHWTCTPVISLPEGANTLTANQTDDAGNASPDATVSFTVDTQAPAPPVVTGPAAGAVIAQNRPTISGTGEAGASLVVTENGATVCTATVGADGTWTCVPTQALDNGDHTITAKQTDRAGNQSGPSTPVTFAVDADKPAPPAITGPASGSTLTDPTPAISGTGEPLAHVVVTEGGNVLCEADVAADGQWACTPETELTDGTHTITATQQDAAGNQSDPSPSVTFAVDAHNPDPPVITAPAPGGTTGQPKPVFTGTGEPGATVTIVEGGTLLCEATVQPDNTWTCTSTVTLPDGPHSVTAVQTDPAGNASDPSPSTFTVDTAPPPLTLNPSDGTSITGTTDPGVTVQITDSNGNPIPGCEAVTADAQGNFSCTPTTPVADGNSIHATATSPSGATAQQTQQASRTNSLVIDSVTLVPPGGVPKVSGTGQPGYQVTVMDGTTPLCTATVGSDGTWTCTSSVKLGGGDHTVTALQTSSTGVMSPSVARNIAVPVTQVVLDPVTNPASGARPVLSGTGEPGFHVTVTGATGTLCETDVKDDGTWSCISNTRLTAGDYSLTATQTDPSGNPTTPAKQTVSVPAADVSVNPVDTTPGTRPVFSGTGEPGYSVAVKDSGNPVCTTTVNTDGTWTCQADQPFTGGQHQITVTQTAPNGTPTATVQTQLSVPTTTHSAPTGGTPIDSTGAMGAGLALLSGLCLLAVALVRRARTRSGETAG